VSFLFFLLASPSTKSVSLLLGRRSAGKLAAGYNLSLIFVSHLPSPPSVPPSPTRARQLPPFRLVRLAPEESLRDDEKDLREKAGEQAHKRISVSAEEVRVRSDGGSSERGGEAGRCRFIPHHAPVYL